MGRRKQSKGKCAFCGREMTRSGLARHFAACSARKEAIRAAERKSGRKELLYHLQVVDADNPDYWLHLEMTGSATLTDLDDYLRAIWLECCNHLSMFYSGNWSEEEISMKTRAKRVFAPGVVLTHIYDFGTESRTLIKVVGMREGEPLSDHPIVLMGRNNEIEMKCMECNQKASWLCIECVAETYDPGTLCDEHVKEHPHREYGYPLPLVNSPRMGKCAYCGPAEPPY